VQLNQQHIQTKKFMKKLFFLVTSFCFYTNAISQVGINTKNPQGIFHIDGRNDNPTTGTPNTSQQTDDFIVTSSGNVGIGTTTPTRKLEIVSPTTPALRIQDGNQNVNYVLMSDNNGYGTWKALSNAISVSFPDKGYSGAIVDGTNDKWTNVTLQLPPGKWLVLTNIVLNATTNPSNGKGAWVRLYWSEINTGVLNGFYGGYNSGSFMAPYGNAIGTTLITNTTNSPKTYYLMVGNIDIVNSYTGNWNDLGGKQWSENSIIAYPAN
jgi:hypothetical protein